MINQRELGEHLIHRIDHRLARAADGVAVILRREIRHRPFSPIGVRGDEAIVFLANFVRGGAPNGISRDAKFTVPTAKNLFAISTNTMTNHLNFVAAQNQRLSLPSAKYHTSADGCQS